MGIAHSDLALQPTMNACIVGIKTRLNTLSLNAHLMPAL